MHNRLCNEYKINLTNKLLSFNNEPIRYSFYEVLSNILYNLKQDECVSIKLNLYHLLKRGYNKEEMVVPEDQKDNILYLIHKYCTPFIYGIVYDLFNSSLIQEK
jgi:hypothetical protein